MPLHRGPGADLPGCDGVLVTTLGMGCRGAGMQRARLGAAPPCCPAGLEPARSPGEGWDAAQGRGPHQDGTHSQGWGGLGARLGSARQAAFCGERGMWATHWPSSNSSLLIPGLGPQEGHPGHRAGPLRSTGWEWDQPCSALPFRGCPEAQRGLGPQGPQDRQAGGKAATARCSTHPTGHATCQGTKCFMKI